jgi:fibrillarin-like pre-rRNA processing protein
VKSTKSHRRQKNLNRKRNGKVLSAEKEVLATEKAAIVEMAEANDPLTEAADPQDAKVEAEALETATADHAMEATDASADMAAERIDATETAVKNKDRKNVGLRVKPHPVFKEIYNVTLEDGAKRLGTKNLVPGKNVYGERLVKFKGVEYRVWDAFRSKLAGAIIKGLQNVPIEPGFKVLYLGAASGTTPSHVSDIVGESGHVYCVEFAQRSLRDLVNNVAQFRPNITPMLEDARMPERYAMFISGKVDTIYCDVAQPEQAKLLADNADVFLKPSGWVMLACKSQSIDVTMSPDSVYQQEARILKKRGYNVTEIVPLDPYDKAHAMILAQKT